MIVKGVLYREEVVIMNVYNPPGQPGDSLTTCFAEITDLNVRNSFIGGDFNCHLNPVMDKSPPGKMLLSPRPRLSLHFMKI